MYMYVRPAYKDIIENKVKRIQRFSKYGIYNDSENTLGPTY